MRKFYYCPSCGKETVVTNDRENPYRGEDTILNIRVLNIRGGDCRHILHYKCECGNYLAGCMDIAGLSDHGVDYVKSIIEDYQRDGKLLGEGGEKWYADAKRAYDTMHSYPENGAEISSHSPGVGQELERELEAGDASVMDAFLGGFIAPGA